VNEFRKSVDIWRS